MLSFPRPGATLAIDFAFEGEATLRLPEDLDTIVRAHSGAVYPTKDARMSAESFHTFFPSCSNFAAMWPLSFRRVSGGAWLAA